MKLQRHISELKKSQKKQQGLKLNKIQLDYKHIHCNLVTIIFKIPYKCS